MMFAPFAGKFPAIARMETRTLMVLEGSDLPADNYGLLEFYCNKKDCDCRRMFLYIVSEKRNATVAVIGFGWEDRKFYEKWLGYRDKKDTDEMIGPSLNTMSPQSELASVLLKHVRSVLQDKQYVERIKRHYRMFKDKVANELKS